MNLDAVLTLEQALWVELGMTRNKYEMKSLSGTECGVVSAAHRHMVIIPAYPSTRDSFS